MKYSMMILTIATMMSALLAHAAGAEDSLAESTARLDCQRQANLSQMRFEPDANVILPPKPHLSYDCYQITTNDRQKILSKRDYNNWLLEYEKLRADPRIIEAGNQKKRLDYLMRAEEQGKKYKVTDELDYDSILVTQLRHNVELAQSYIQAWRNALTIRGPEAKLHSNWTLEPLSPQVGNKEDVAIPTLAQSLRTGEYATIEHIIDKQLPTHYLILDQTLYSRYRLQLMLPLLRQGLVNLVIVPVNTISSRPDAAKAAADFMANSHAFEYLQMWTEHSEPKVSNVTQEHFDKVAKNSALLVSQQAAAVPMSVRLSGNEVPEDKMLYGVGLNASKLFFDKDALPAKAWNDWQLSIRLAELKKAGLPRHVLTPLEKADLTEQICNKQGQCWKATNQSPAKGTGKSVQSDKESSDTEQTGQRKKKGLLSFF